MDKNKQFIQEFGEQSFKDLFEKASMILFGKHSLNSINTATNYNFKLFNEKKCSAFGSYKSDTMDFEFEIIFGRHPHTVTYYHNNNTKKSSTPTQTISNQSPKVCTCDWNHVKKNGCKCGAIKPYKPQY